MIEAIHYTMTGVGLVLTIGFLGYAIYDLILVVFFGKASTISQFMIAVGFKAPFIVFTFGYVAGHLWSSMYADNCIAMPPTSMPWFQMAQSGVFGIVLGFLARYLMDRRSQGD